MESPFYQKPRRFGDREPRSGLRQGIQTIARYTCPSQEKETEIQTQISNLSERGAFFVTLREGLPLGAEVRAAFRLPGLESRLLTVSGKVIRVSSLPGNQHGSGIEFFDLSEKTKLAIREFVSTQQLGETL